MVHSGEVPSLSQTIKPSRGGHLCPSIVGERGIVDRVGWTTNIWGVGDNELKHSHIVFNSTSQCFIL